jgi:hypothetical protein
MNFCPFDKNINLKVPIVWSLIRARKISIGKITQVNIGLADSNSEDKSISNIFYKFTPK